MNGRNPKKQKVNEKVFSEDVLTEILIRLPAKQIDRMRCVCKRWNRLLSEPYFVKSHLHLNKIRNKNKDSEILLVLTFSEKTFTKEDDGLMITLTAHPSRSPDKKLDDLIKLPDNFPRSNVDWRVIGSVNGLICFTCGFDHDIYMWNPSLSVVMRLPDSTSFGRSKSYEFSFRFGFDPKSDDYKVVKLVRCDLVSDLQVEVYSMRKGTWRVSSESFPSNVYKLVYHENKVYDHDGHVYWLCLKHSDNCKTIVAFDLGAETFFEISLPPSLTKSNTCLNKLCFFARKLCVAAYNLDDKVYEIWVMNEYGVTESWVKHSKLSSRVNWNIDPVGFTLNNEVYFRERYHGRLALYDPEDTTKVKYFDHCHVNDITRIVQYVDSLVWITPAQKRGMKRHKRDSECA